MKSIISSGRPRQELPWGIEQHQPQSQEHYRQQQQQQQFQQNPILAYSNRPSSAMSEFTPRVSGGFGMVAGDYNIQHSSPRSQQHTPQQGRSSSAMLTGNSTQQQSLPYHQYQQQRQQQYMNLQPLVRPSSNPTPSRLRSPHLAFGKVKNATLSRSDLSSMK